MKDKGINGKKKGRKAPRVLLPLNIADGFNRRAYYKVRAPGFSRSRGLVHASRPSLRSPRLPQRPRGSGRSVAVAPTSARLSSEPGGERSCRLRFNGGSHPPAFRSVRCFT